MKLIFQVIMFLPVMGAGQDVKHIISPIYQSPGLYNKNNPDIFSCITNQAALSHLKNTSAALYTERRFLLKELNLFTGIIGVHTNSGNFCLKASYFGFNRYNETQIGIGYGRGLGNNLDIGVQFNYNGVRIPGYGNSAAINFELGSIVHLTDKLQVGMHVSNPAPVISSKQAHGKIASVLTLGFGYLPSEKFEVRAEIEKEQDFPIDIKVSTGYKFLPQLIIGSGMATANENGFLTVGFIKKSYRLQLVINYHLVLGITPALLLVFQNKSTEH